MASSKNRVLWSFFADTKNLERGLKRTQKGFKDTTTSTSGLARGFDKIKGAVGPMLAAFGAQQIASFALDAIKAGENAEIAAESLEKVLGPAADDLRTRFDELREVMGFTEGEFDTMATSLGLLFTSQGIAADDAAELVGDLVEIGGNLAAFSPSIGTAEQAVSDLTGAIRGEFDPLEKWGVKLSAAKVKAEKARLVGLDPLFASMSDGKQDIIAITKLVERGAAPAMDALATHAETAAGKTAILTTKMNDLKAEIGQELLPVYTDLLALSLDVAPALDNVVGAVRASLEPFTALVGLVEDLKDPLAAVTENTDFSAKALAGQAWDIVKYVNPALWALDEVIGVAGHSIGEMVEPTETLTKKFGKVHTTGGDAADGIDEAGQAAKDEKKNIEDMRDALALFNGTMVTTGELATDLFKGGVGQAAAARAAAGTAATGKAGKYVYATGTHRVPGPQGRPTMAVVHGGETITAPGQQGGGGNTYNLNITAIDPASAAEAVADAIRYYESTNGSISA